MRLSNTVSRLKPSGIRRFFDLAEKDPDIISLGVGEPDFVTPDMVLDAAQTGISDGNTHYTSNDGLFALRTKISEYLKMRFGLNYNPNGEIIVTIGASEAVDIALTAVISPGDEVLIPEPCFVSYAPCALLSGGTPIAVPTYEEHSFKLSVEVLEKHVSDKTRAIILSYPNNPTGAIMTLREMKAIAEFAQKHDLAVISDEIYAELTYGRNHESIVSIKGMKDRTFLIGGFSKSNAMTGWRIGYLSGPYDAVQAARKVHQFRVMCPPTISQIAAVEALNSGELEVKRMVNEYNTRRKLIYEGFKHMGFQVIEPKGAFYIFPSVRHTGLSSEEFAEKLLEYKVAVVPGNAFGESGEGYIRCSYATSIENINEALNRIDMFVSRFKHTSSVLR
jgi:aminotransferase